MVADMGRFSKLMTPEYYDHQLVDIADRKGALEAEFQSRLAALEKEKGLIERDREEARMLSGPLKRVMLAVEEIEQTRKARKTGSSAGNAPAASSTSAPPVSEETAGPASMASVLVNPEGGGVNSPTAVRVGPVDMDVAPPQAEAVEVETREGGDLNLVTPTAGVSWADEPEGDLQPAELHSESHKGVADAQAGSLEPEGRSVPTSSLSDALKEASDEEENGLLSSVKCEDGD
jgi:hypothetical protein